MKKNVSFNNGLLIFLSISFIITLLISCGEDKPVNHNQSDSYLAHYLHPEHLWGLLDLNNKVVYKPTFDELRPFQESYAAVNIKGKWGFIDTNLTTIIEPQYRAAWNFHSGLARIQQISGSYNYINSSNETLFDEDFLYAHDFINSFATAKIGQDSFIILGANGYKSDIVKAQDLSPTPYGYFIAEHFESEAIYNSEGKDINNIFYDRIRAVDPHAIVAVQDGFQALISIEKEILIPFDYRRISTYENGWTIASAEQGIDIYKNHNLIRHFDEYIEVRYAGHDRFVFMKAGLWGIMDTEFNIITEAIYNQLDNFSQNVAPYSKGELWGYVNINGIELTEPMYGIATPYRDNYARVMFYEGMAVLDKNQKIKIPPSNRTYRDVSASYIPFKGR